MASQQFLETQCHEFDAYLNFDEYGLKPYYGLTSFWKALVSLNRYFPGKVSNSVYPR
ncbi:DUF7845 domain-containing protein [Natrinema limicola]